jgi:hypothetical protein
MPSRSSRHDDHNDPDVDENPTDRKRYTSPPPFPWLPWQRTGRVPEGPWSLWQCPLVSEKRTAVRGAAGRGTCRKGLSLGRLYGQKTRKFSKSRVTIGGQESRGDAGRCGRAFVAMDGPFEAPIAPSARAQCGAANGSMYEHWCPPISAVIRDEAWQPGGIKRGTAATAVTSRRGLMMHQSKLARWQPRQRKRQWVRHNQRHVVPHKHSSGPEVCQATRKKEPRKQPLGATHDRPRNSWEESTGGHNHGHSWPQISWGHHD